jgi:hypothetical protein
VQACHHETFCAVQACHHETYKHKEFHAPNEHCLYNAATAGIDNTTDCVRRTRS